MKFEIHITGSKNILKHLAADNQLTVEMLDRSGEVFDTDYMSAIDFRGSYIDMLTFVANLINYLTFRDVDIYRVKVETQPSPELFQTALYIERHFEMEKADDYVYPVSLLANKNKYVGTSRTYNRSEFAEFANRYDKTELCIIDSNVNHDKDWFDIWEK